MSVTAIDVLLEPDQRMISRARSANGRMRSLFPDGFELDADHAAHVTVVQSFVRTAQLGEVAGVVAKVFDSLSFESLELEATGLYYLPWEDLAIAGITIAPTAELLALQASIIDALAPFAETSGDRRAFVGEPESATIRATADYVGSFAVVAAGAAYNPHVTIGVALAEDVDVMLAEPFDPFTFHAESGAIYQLGDLGTAQLQLWSSKDAGR